ncbi:GyrI-like domain-containing protein [Paenibacillus tarimensis]|uniref:GyrI-like domain-containing protein n=1 Tax=Paenibacillus tarimensis TaxID=416012 RepID=UPI001F1967B8|nr:effector binding domain-containing protein [Paenibacillus tarimensis]MCF2944255.1 GyrI-like domain-containing protein [Paenibacillus tarimensis]
MIEPTIIELGEMKIGGLHVRAMETERGKDSAVERLWEQFRSSDRCIAKEAEARNPSVTYALYAEYNRSDNGACTIVIGQEVSGDDAFEEGADCKIVTLPASRYAVFTTRPGPALEVTAETWSAIDRYFESSAYRRRYSGDFELYDAKSSNPGETIVDIYISVTDEP